MTIEFEKKSDSCSVAFIERPKQSLKAVRTIRESDGWRIDQAGSVAGAWLPWEPISDTRFGDQDSAEKAIRSWAID